MGDLNSSVVSAASTVGCKPFQIDIVREWGEVNIVDTYLVYLSHVMLNPGAWVKYFVLSMRQQYLYRCGRRPETPAFAGLPVWPL